MNFVTDWDQRAVRLFCRRTSRR